MVWIYLIVQAVGLGIIAWSFKAEEKNEYAVAFGIGGFLSLCLVVAVAPLPVKLMTGFLMVRFRSRLNLAFAGGQAAILSGLRMSLQVLRALGATDFDLAARLMRDPLSKVLAHPVFCRWPEPQTANEPYGDSRIIDIEAIEVTAP